MPENVKLSRKNTELKLTHSREQSPSWKADSQLASK
jgi:hypothetical protein